MKKMVATLIALSLLSACGKDNTVYVPVPSPAPTPVVNTSVLGVWQGEDFGTLDLSTLAIGNEESAQVVLTCDGALGNAGLVKGVSEGNVLITASSETTGTIQFGHLPYVGATDPRCSQLSKEGYFYSIKGNKMLIVPLNYPQYPDTLSQVL